MRRHLPLLALIVSVLSLPVLAETPTLPNSDIAVFELVKNRAGLAIDRPVVFAQSPGYDNQPHFSPDSSGIYFTRIENSQAHLWHWSAETGSHQWAKSPLSEYSPTPMLDGSGRLSTVRVEQDESQRLWSYDPKRGFQLLFESIKPVGYHAWSGTRVALFVLGEPHQLHIAQLGQESSKIVDRRIGRCLQKIPGEDAVSYTVEEGKRHRLKSYNFSTGKTRTLRLLPGESQDYVWLDSKVLISSNGSNLLCAEVDSEKPWKKLGNRSNLTLNEISRLAISPDGEKLAVVYVVK